MKQKVLLLLERERIFLITLSILFITASLVFRTPSIAMWFGFLIAAYSAVANDSIQTIGTFISSNEDKRWWILWIFIGGIFLATVTYSWVQYDGDVSYQRLSSKGFDKAPVSFYYLQIAAPIILLLLTRMRMPVSTTFLLLSSFTTESGAIIKVITKSLSGYFIAFLGAFLVWIILAPLIKRIQKGTAHFGWTIAQWITSGALWAVWIMQDAANIAVFLPRSLNIYEFIAFASVIFFGLGLIFYNKGDKIQEVINEKSSVKDVRSATLIDFVYALILFVFQYVSTIPMSTTWVFIGLLAGRELGMHYLHHNAEEKNLSRTLGLISKDVLYTLFGLAVSIALALAVNPAMRKEFQNLF